MTQPSRREFVKLTAAGALAAAALSASKMVHASSEKRMLNVGVIGCGSRGGNAAITLAGMENVNLQYLCDVNSQNLADTVKKLNSSNVTAVKDMRQLFDNPKLDAVLIATPDHWHAPAGILACEAGKHVYVEKACSHNVREGRLLVEAARRNKRVVQHGTQVRSTPTIMQGVKLLQDGIIGDVLMAKVWNVQRRGDIGRMKPGTPPEFLDYNLWVGPAPAVPFKANVFSNWHMSYHFGTGDMGNDGVHDLEYGRWGLGVQGHPTKVVALGDKLVFDDDQDFPDTQQVTFEYRDGAGKKPRYLTYEQRLWSTNYPSVYNCDSGAEFYGTEGRMFLSRRGKFQVLGPNNKRLDVKVELTPQDDRLHIANFLECIRTGAKPNAEIEEGHLTSTLCHLGNIATRLGRSFEFDAATEKFVDDDEANASLTREYREHWATPRGV